ncbi:MAG: geranylgeranylglyceryl phosphate synthase family protein, partial [Paludibacteraceae bacterium]|nr:geranylgeranylglyceryl phosphate synthase family protein [Paludibacteraceae bacterium]
PAVLFPGNAEQLTEAADALLLPSVISGRNAEMLIGAHVRAAKQIQALDIEVIPMGYILVNGGKESSVSKVSGTQPIPQENIEEIVQTAIAGELLGKQVIYLEAGSGAIVPVQQEVIKAVRQAVRVPLLVGGGIKTKAMAEQAWLSGADIVVIGNGLE